MYNGFKQFLGDIYNYKCEQLSGGVSYNTQYLCTVNDKKYVVRVLKEPLPTRHNEVSVHLFAANKFFAPMIHYYEHNEEFSFVIMDFINGHTLTLDEAHRFDVLDLMAEKIRLIHQWDASLLPYSSKRDLFAEITENYKKIKNKNLCSFLIPILEEVLHKAEIINQKVKSEQRLFVVNHNDLLPRNIFFTGNNIVIIDWENVGLNDVFYDLASYSMFACLNDEDDFYLLTQYLQRSPLYSDIQHFKCVKLMSRVFDTFSVFAFLDYISESIPMESIEDFMYYQNIFAQDSSINSSEFLYAMTLGQIREFFKEYKRCEEEYL